MKIFLNKIHNVQIIFFFLLIIVMNWVTNNTNKVDFQFDVNNYFNFKITNTHYLYLYIHIFSLVPVLLLSFDKKIAYYKKWKTVLPSIFIVAVIFIIWDICKTASNVWTFNPDYYVFKILNLPIEEWFFFFTFPFAAIFIHQCLHGYFSFSRFLKYEKIFSLTIMFLLVFLSCIYWNRLYTLVTSLFGTMVLLISLKNWDAHSRLNYYISFIFISFPFILTDLIWTGYFTESPIVIYNTFQFSNIRLRTIPIEDFIYNYSLILLILIIDKEISKKISNELIV
jgi:lycopene cyclase domain-containing protein